MSRLTQSSVNPKTLKDLLEYHLEVLRGTQSPKQSPPKLE